MSAPPNFESNPEFATGSGELGPDEEYVVDPVTGERGIVKKAIVGGLATGVAAFAYKKYQEHHGKGDKHHDKHHDKHKS